MKESKNTFSCQCGTNQIALTFHQCMPSELVDQVFCPECEEKGLASSKSIPIPGGWRVHFDLEVAKMFAMAKLKIDPQLINPGFIIDGGYID